VKDELIYNELIVSARDEISILKKMNNPNIIRIFDHIETIERIYVIVEVRMQHILKFCPISLS
jgi:serine/threonine protein kinase